MKAMAIAIAAVTLLAACAAADTRGDCTVKQIRTTEVVCRGDGMHKAIIVFPQADEY